MRKLLFFLLLAPLFSIAQPNVGPSEYDCYFINPAGGLLHLSAGLPAPMNVPASLTWKAVFGGLHTGAAIDNNTNLWTFDNGPLQITADSAGNSFTNIVQVAIFASTGQGIYAVKGDGTLWVWGNLNGYMRGNGSSGGTWSKPVQVIIPGGRKVSKVCASMTTEILCTDGTVWGWGGWSAIAGTKISDVSRPQQIILPQAAKDIAGGGQWSYAVGKDGTLYGWGLYNNAMFGSYTGGQILSPLDLTKYMGFPLPVEKVFVNTISSYFILTDGSLWSNGDNIVGSLGNGRQADQANSPYPYAVWPDPAAPYQLLEPKPTQILPGTKFTEVYVATPDVFYLYARSANGQLYSAGRNKGGILGNGIIECDMVQGLIGAQRPNSWNVPLLTPVNPLALKNVTKVTSPYCLLAINANSSPCNLCPLPNQPPKAAISSAGSITLPVASIALDGSGSIDPDGKIVSYTWTKMSGPRGDSLSGNAAAAIQAFLLQPGLYIYQLTVADNAGATSAAQATIRVNPVPACPAVDTAGIIRDYLAAHPCPVCPPQRSVTAAQVTINGQVFSIPLSWIKFAFSDGATQ